MESQALIIAVLILITSSIELALHVRYGDQNNELQFYFENKYPNLWRAWWESGEAKTLAYYGLSTMVRSSGPLAQLKVLKFIKEQISKPGVVVNLDDFSCLTIIK